MMERLRHALLQFRPQGGGSPLLKGAGVVFVIQASGTAVKYLVQVLFARWMGATEYGIFAYLFSWVNFLGFFATMGFTTASLRFVPEYIAKRDWSRLRGYLRFSRQAVFVVGLLLGGLEAVILPCFRTNPAIPKVAVWAGASLVPLFALSMVQMEMIRGAKRTVAAYAPLLWLQPGLALVAAYTAWKTYGSLHGVVGLWVFGVALLGVLLVQQLGLLRSIPRQVWSVHPTYATSAWLRVSLPLLLEAGSWVVLQQADILMVGVLLGPKFAGIYTVAAKTSAAIGFILIAINAVSAPFISELYSTGKPAELKNLVATATRWMFWPSFVLGVAAVIFGRPILGFFGHEFTEGYAVLVLLVLARIVHAGVGTAGYLLALTGHQAMSARVYSVSALLNIVLNLILISTLGLMGASLATFLVTLLWNIWLYRLAQGTLGLRPSVLG